MVDVDFSPRTLLDPMLDPDGHPTAHTGLPVGPGRPYTSEAAPRSSSGPGHRPLKAETTGSNPVRGTRGTEHLLGLFLISAPVAVSYARLGGQHADTWTARNRDNR